LDWGVDRVDAEIVWGGSDGALSVTGDVTGDGVDVAVIDTGIDYTHPDLDANYAGGYDFANGDDDPKDDNGHGTHCSGTIAAEDNGEGVIGMAPYANILAVKALDKRGSGSISDICAGIDWAVNNGAEVISMSLGIGSSYDTLKNSCDNAYASGVLLVAASGNDGDGDASTDEVSYPAAYSSVIAVGATDSDDNIASFSSSGPHLELGAPGVDIYSTMPTYSVHLNTGLYGYSQNYDTMSGTSMACPHVSGGAALVFDKGVDDADGDGYINDDVRNVLGNNAENIGLHENFVGNGLLDAEAAVNAAGGGSDTNSAPDAPTNPSPSDGATGVSTSPTLSVDVSDPDGDSMDVSFYDASDDSLIGTDTGVASGGTASVTWSGLSYSTTYSWYTVADDGSATTTSSTWQFTTEEETTSGEMHVQDVYLWLDKTRGPWEDIGVEVTIVDSNGNAVSDATVDIELETPEGKFLTATATTDSSGVASNVFAKASRTSGTYTGTVLDVTHSSYSYDSSANNETSDTLTTS
ncbi:MAG: S8 family serine peptidase, partial [Thermoplasmatota archaeon]